MNNNNNNNTTKIRMFFVFVFLFVMKNRTDPFETHTKKLCHTPASTVLSRARRKPLPPSNAKVTLLR